MGCRHYLRTGLVLALFSVLSAAFSFTDTNSTHWSQGTFVNTTYNDTDAYLSGTNASGTFERVWDAGAPALWDVINWTSSIPVTEVAHGKPCTASSEGSTTPCNMSVDGNYTSTWNAEVLAPAWIKIDLQSNHTIYYVVFYCGGTSGHYGNVTLLDENNNTLNTTPFADAGSPCKSDSPMTITYPNGVQNVRYIMDNATGGGDWVAMTELQAYNTTFLVQTSFSQDNSSWSAWRAHNQSSGSRVGYYASPSADTTPRGRFLRYRATWVDTTAPAQLSDVSANYSSACGSLSLNTTLFDDVLYSGSGNCMTISSSNVVLDCAGKWVNSTTGAASAGIYVAAANVTVRNCLAGNWTAGYGIRVYGAAGANISSNTAKNNQYGIIVYGGSSNTTLFNNTANNNQYGIYVYGASNTTLTNNTANNNDYGIYLTADYTTMRNNSMDNNFYNGFDLVGSYTAAHFDNDIDTSNTVNGEPLYYLNRRTNYVLEGLNLVAANTSIAKVIVSLSNNVTVRNSVLRNTATGVGIAFVHSNNSLASNVTASNNCIGVYVGLNSWNNTVAGSTASNNRACIYYSSGYGVYLDSTAYNSSIENSAFSGNDVAVYAGSSSLHLLYNNSMTSAVNNIDASSGSWVLAKTLGAGQIRYSSMSTNNSVTEDMYYVAVGVAAVNSSANTDLNTSAEITMPFSGTCPRVNLYFYDNYSTSLSEIISYGRPCNSSSTPSCVTVSCSGSTVTFSVTRFSSYGGQGYEIPEFSLLTAVGAFLVAAAGYALARENEVKFENEAN